MTAIEDCAIIGDCRSAALINALLERRPGSVR
jgi:hypothetical protein